MKVNIRNSVFETNSSSSHAVNVDPAETYDFSIDKESLRNGVLRVELRSFGQKWERFRTTENKVAYLAAQLCANLLNDQPRGSDVRRIVKKNARGERLIAVLENTLGCKVELIRPDTSSSFAIYVDHESIGIGMEVFNSDEELKTFLFSKNSYVTTGNDNVQPPFNIENDLGETEEYHEFRYERVLRDEPLFELETDEDFSVVKLKTPRVDVLLDDVEWGDRYKLKEAFDQVTILGAAIKCRNPYRETSPKQDLFSSLDEWHKYQDSMSIKLFELVTVQTRDPDCNDPNEDYETKIFLECAMPEDKLRELEHVALKVSGNIMARKM